MKEKNLYYKIFDDINEAFDQLKAEILQKIDKARLEFHAKIQEKLKKLETSEKEKK